MPYHLPGSYRDVLPECTFKKVSAFLKELGVTRLANISGLDGTNILPVYSCIRPNSKNISITNGKGLTGELAKLSALMEAFERHHAETIPHASPMAMDELSGEAIPPAEFPNSLFRHPFSERDKIEWLQGENLYSGKEVFVPRACFSLDTSVQNEDQLFALSRTTGLASGNTLDEATCHSLFEIIERNCTAEFKMETAAQQEEREINLVSIKDKPIRSLISKLKQARSDLKIYETTNQFNIPSFYTVLYEKGALSTPSGFSGKGCHFDKSIALLRAITESVQNRTAVNSGARDDLYFDTYRKLRKPFLAKEINSSFKRDFQSVVSYELGFFAEIKKRLIKIISDFGYRQIVLVNLTKPKFEIPVVHIIIPGLLI
jgi:ribosomal protein S12 methylthiotransferase accessory factor